MSKEISISKSIDKVSLRALDQKLDVDMFRLRREAKANYEDFAGRINNLKLEAIKVQSENSDLSNYIYGANAKIRNMRNAFKPTMRGSDSKSAARMMFENIHDVNQKAGKAMQRNVPNSPIYDAEIVGLKQVKSTFLPSIKNGQINKSTIDLRNMG